MQLLVHVTFLGESKPFLVNQEWGQEDGGVKGEMVIRKRRSFSAERQNVEKTSIDFMHKFMECQGERVKLSAIKGCGSKPTEADMRKVKQEILSTLNRIKKKYFCVSLELNAM